VLRRQVDASRQPVGATAAARRRVDASSGHGEPAARREAL